jgi:hypothetical protein
MGPKTKSTDKQTKSNSVSKSQKTLSQKQKTEKDKKSDTSKIEKKLEISRLSRKPDEKETKTKQRENELKSNNNNNDRIKNIHFNNLKNKDLNLNLEDSIEHIDLVKSIPENNNINNNIFYNDNQNDLSRNEIVNITPNINGINRVLNNSEEIINEQRKILEKFSEVNSKLANSEFDVQRLSSKLENDDLSLFNDKYSDCLRQVIAKLKSHNEELEEIKCKNLYIKILFIIIILILIFIYICIYDILAIKEENKNLKYKLELWSIDKNDSQLSAEVKFNSVKNFLTNEMNTFNEFIIDLGYDSLSSEKLK